jgi:hypothetical protein
MVNPGDDLVERLRKRSCNWFPEDGAAAVLDREAADEIEDLRRVIAELTEQLEPVENATAS